MQALQLKSEAFTDALYFTFTNLIFTEYKETRKKNREKMIEEIRNSIKELNFILNILLFLYFFYSKYIIF